MIEKAGVAELPQVLHVLSSCTQWLFEQGMGHWHGAHGEDSVRKRILEDNVFLLHDNCVPCGTVTKTSNPPLYYKDCDHKFWESANSPATYISGLAVLPNHQGKGFASKLLDFTEEITKREGVRYIRFDAIVDYEDLTDFYLKRGYNIVGRRLTGGVESNFFEKKLT